MLFFKDLVSDFADFLLNTQPSLWPRVLHQSNRFFHIFFYRFFLIFGVRLTILYIFSLFARHVFIRFALLLL